MLWRLSVLLGMLMGAPALLLAGETGVDDKHPVYVGTRACTKCHRGPVAGHQFSLWRMSEHANAYASLWSPEAKAIAVLSGIPEEPQKAANCLGCHATGADAEEWEKEDLFYLQDGVQCERCHGPGSEYMAADIMIDHEKAVQNGLKTPTDRDCMMCHNEKGSHVAILKDPTIDLEAGKKAIAHPVPDEDEVDTDEEDASCPGSGDEDDPPARSKFRFTGVMACAECHKGKEMGYQFSKWRLSKHARAYAVLGTPKGYAAARKQGVRGNPQESEKCLRCHSTGAGFSDESFLEGFDPGDGVGCEACHGPGEEYSPEAVMRDKRLAKQFGLAPVTRETCIRCHRDTPEYPFDFDAEVQKIAHPTRLPEQAAAPRYKTPLNLAISPDGGEIYVACEASDSVIVVSVSRREKIDEIQVGGQPNDVTFHPDGSRAYVTNRLDDSVSIVDTQRRSVIRTIPVGDEPHGILLDAAGKTIYVLNTSSDDISVIDDESLQEVRRLSASRAPWSLALSPDGKRLAATNTLSRFTRFRESSVSEVTIIDTETGVVVDRRAIRGANLLQGVAWHPSGKFALITLDRTKNLVPMTRLLQGWTITNGIGIVWRDGAVDQLLLDEPDMCFPDPADVAITPDGKHALVTSSGSDRVAVVDIEKLLSMVEGASEHEREHVLPNHLGKPTEFVVAHVPTRNSPRGVVIAGDGQTAFVANALDDSLTVIDMATFGAAGRIDLGGPQEITKVRLGERVFHSANITFRRQFSCHTCHPDGHIDGLTYDIEPDGIGISPVDNRTLRGILDSAPFKWEGTNPSLQRQCGPRLAVFFTRIQPFTPEQLSALDTYICTIPRPPNRHRTVGGELTPAQRRGKAMFERTRTNDGRLIAEDNRCVTCHFPPLYTDRSRRNVGTMMQYDRESDFDVPHLSNIYDSAPYLHNGISATLEEIWTRYNPDDRHGVTNDMTKDQLNDLIEFLKTL